MSYTVAIRRGSLRTLRSDVLGRLPRAVGATLWLVCDAAKQVLR